MKTKKVIKKKKVVKKVAKTAVKKAVAKRNAPLVTPVAQPYLVNLKFTHGSFEAEGKTVTECLQKMEKPAFMKSKGIVTVFFEGKQSRITLFPFQVKRLLLGKIDKEIFEKRMLNILK